MFRLLGSHNGAYGYLMTNRLNHLAGPATEPREDEPEIPGAGIDGGPQPGPWSLPSLLTSVSPEMARYLLETARVCLSHEERGIRDLALFVEAAVSPLVEIRSQADGYSESPIGVAVEIP